LTATTAVARIECILLHALRPRHQIDEVEELAALLRARWCGVALDHAHQTNLGHAPAHHVERLHQPAEPIALHLECGAHGFRLWAAAQVNRHRWLRRLRFGLARTCACFGAGFARRSFGARGGVIRRSL
jgi:hypothetical protein